MLPSLLTLPYMNVEKIWRFISVFFILSRKKELDEKVKCIHPELIY